MAWKPGYVSRTSAIFRAAGSRSKTALKSLFMLCQKPILSIILKIKPYLLSSAATVGNWFMSVCGRKRADMYSSMKFLETDSSM